MHLRGPILVLSEVWKMNVNGIRNVEPASLSSRYNSRMQTVMKLKRITVISGYREEICAYLT